MTFEEWQAKVSALVVKATGCLLTDLIDIPYREAFDDEVPADEMADEIIAGIKNFDLL